MKFRAISLAALVAALTLGVWAQDSTPTTPPATTTPTTDQSTPTNQSGTPTIPSATNIKHDGGKDDVDAIGNRKIGGRGMGDWYSLEKEMALGKQYAQEIESTVKLVQDPVVNEYINRVGQNIVRNSDCKVPFTIKVVDDDTVNAFAIPGGFFYVDSGLILAADNESEIAGVMAHEIAHVCARHGMRQMTRANWANLATIPLIFVGGGIGYGARAAVSLALPLTFMKFSRGFEAEADYLGIQYAYKSGYDPNGMIDMFEKIEAQEKKKPGTIAKAFASHPQLPDRIEASQKEIATILPPLPGYMITTSEFDEVKTRLAEIESRHKITDTNDKDRPSLKRSNKNPNPDNPDQTNPNNKDDDRPTLHKRDNP